MRLKDDYLLHDTGNGEILLAVGEATKNFHGIIKLNETGAKIAHMLKDKDCSLEEIEKQFFEEYPDEDKEIISSSIKEFIAVLEGADAILR